MARIPTDLRALAMRTGFDIEPARLASGYRISCRGKVMLNARGVAAWELTEAKRYLSRFPDAEQWLR